MSYNISRIKIHALSLSLPLDFDFQGWLTTLPDKDKHGYENAGKRWCREEGSEVTILLSSRAWKLVFVGDIVLRGTVLRGATPEKALSATTLDCEGECSGNLFSDVILPLFAVFKGEFEAIVIWEHGDTVARVSVHDGTIEEKELA